MTKVLAVRAPSHDQGEFVLSSLHDAVEKKRIELDDIALVSHDADGKLELHKTERPLPPPPDRRRRAEARRRPDRVPGRDGARPGRRRHDRQGRTTCARDHGRRHEDLRGRRRRVARVARGDGHRTARSRSRTTRDSCARPPTRSRCRRASWSRCRSRSDAGATTQTLKDCGTWPVWGRARFRLRPLTSCR